MAKTPEILARPAEKIIISEGKIRLNSARLKPADLQLARELDASGATLSPSLKKKVDKANLRNLGNGS